MNSSNSDKLFCELFGEEDDGGEEEDEDINADLKILEPSEPTYQVEEPVPGLIIYRQVLSHTLCTQYFAWLKNEYFSQSKVNQGMHFGSLDDKAPLRLLSQISHKLPRLLPTTVEFDQAIVNLYECGDGIGDHVDLMRFEDGIVGFSFGGSAVMRMRRVRDMKAAARYARELETEDPSEIAVMLGAGDVYALSGEARYHSDVFVPKDGVHRAGTQILARMQQVGYSTADWKKHALTPSTANAAAIEWIFIVDALNFSFWSASTVSQKEMPNRQYSVTLEENDGGHTYRGYWTLCAAVNRAQSEGIPITDARYWISASDAELEHVFRGDAGTEAMPMLGDRIRVLREVGGVLVEKHQGRFANMLESAQGSARRLVDLVVSEFACFRDEHEFQGRPVAMYKRAQILVADIWACFEGKGLGHFEDIDCVTMFADYRVPQALCHFGALEYSPRLMQYLRESERAVAEVGEKRAAGRVPPVPGLLPSGHQWEMEIRGNSIWAVELIRQHIERESGTRVSAILIDFYLWDYSKEYAKEMAAIPIHLTRSTNY